MRHKNVGKGLSRSSSHRKAMFRNMMVSALQHETIKTTLIKAKELRRFLEPLITLAKTDSIHRRRIAFARLRNEDIVNKLFTDVAPFYKSRPGGYLRILKCGFRAGDKAPIALVQLVGREEASESANAA